MGASDKRVLLHVNADGEYIERESLVSEHDFLLARQIHRAKNDFESRRRAAESERKAVAA